MNTKPKTFRLSKDAQKNLKELADTFNLSENQVVEILLTFSAIGQGPHHTARDILHRYQIAKTFGMNTK